MGDIFDCGHKSRVQSERERETARENDGRILRCHLLMNILKIVHQQYTAISQYL